jgi:hypothetical protein
MFRMFRTLDTQSEAPARRDRTAHQPRRARLGLESLEDRQVPTALLASSAFAVYVPPNPCMPALVARVPSGPIMPALVAHFPPIPI